MQHQPIFAPKDFDPARLDHAFRDIPAIEEKKQKIERWQALIHGGRLLSMKEEQLQDEFLKTFFGDVLGYSYDLSADTCQLEIERSTEFDSKKPDGVLGFFHRDGEATVKAVIELKGSKINLDKKQNRKDFPGTPVEQAFSYVPKMGGQCRWVIVSDFVEIRLYHAADMRRFERFFIPDLFVNDNLKKFFFLLYKDRLFWQNGGTSPIESLLENRQAALEKIEVDFYGDYASKRLLLLNALRRDNTARSDDELMGATQRLLDRLIFIAFVRDMPIVKDVFANLTRSYDESYSTHPQLAWQLLKDLFRAFDKGYSKKSKIIPPFNGGLFQPDALLENLALTDEMVFELVDFVRRYDFKSELDVNILGHIFEKSISDIEKIKADLAAGNDLPAPPTDAANKRKKQGIFYTPEYVTHYIVEQAVGGWLDERRREVLASLGVEELAEPTADDYATITPDGGGNPLILLHRRFWKEYQEQLRRIKVLDPACGSGAFLNQVFNHLYVEWKISDLEIAKLNTPTKAQGDRVNEGIFASGNGGYDGDGYRDAAIRRGIVSKNLYGVDLSAESVEITKLSLWLKTANKSISLADLSENIRQGNSLVDDPAVEPLAFRWEEGFPEIMDGGGFDVVVGNPPYGAELSEKEKGFFKASYKTTEYNFDTYRFFFEASINKLRQNGYLGFITPNTYLVLENGIRLRELLFKQNSIKGLLEVFNVFPDVIVEPIITILKKKASLSTDKFKVLFLQRGQNDLGNAAILYFHQADLFRKVGFVFNYRETPDERKVVEKILSASRPLSHFATVTTGIKPYQVGKGNPKQTATIVDSKPFTSFKKSDESWFPMIRGTQVNRYTLNWDGEYIKYGDWLAEPRTPEIFFSPKVLIRRTDDRLLCVYDENSMVGVNSIHCIQTKGEITDKYLLSLLNSKLLNWFFRHENFHMVGKPLAEVKVVFVERLPVVVSENPELLEGKADLLLQKHRELHEGTATFLRLLQANFPLATLPKKLEDWHRLNWKEFLEEMKKANAPLKPSQQAEWLAVFEEQQKTAGHALAAIEQADRELDRMVFELYGLTEVEVALVEGSA